MSDRVTNITSRLSDITRDARESFGPLASAQLNWKPSADSWSVAQCLDHLIKTNGEMLVAIDSKINGGKNRFLEKWSPLTGFFGRFLLKSLPVDEKKFKAPTARIVPPSAIGPDIVDRFTDQQSIIVEKIVQLDAVDWDRTVITSPFMGLMTYRLSDGIEILVEHERRHLRQAKRVAASAGFPI